eukprot:scaffold19937_cov127-Isochrysis_galbana.AAC.7
MHHAGRSVPPISRLRPSQVPPRACCPQVIWTSAKKLREASVAETSPAPAQGISKFTDDQMSLGEPSMFFKGLDDFIGPPNPNVREAMTHEHTTHKDSRVEFVAHNYETKTTSRHEWFFVVEPKEGLKKTALREWPKEQKPPASRADGPDGFPNKGKTTHLRRPGPRKPTELADFEANLNIKNGLLRDLGEAPVTLDELIGARLYTGPMSGARLNPNPARAHVAAHSMPKGDASSMALSPVRHGAPFHCTLY